MDIKVKKSLIKLLLILVVVGLIVIFAISRQKQSSPTVVHHSTSLTPTTSQIPTDITSLILSYPMSASDGARSKYRDLLKARGKETTSLTITNCKPNPEIIIISRSAQLTITNKDSSDRELRLGADYKKTLAKASSTSISLDFTKGAGLYTIHCGSEQKPVGMLFVTP